MKSAPPPYDEYPYYGRHADDHAHAPYGIMRSLRQLGLAGWSATLLDWLSRYDGLKQHLGEDFEPDPRLDPAVCVRDVLLAHVVVLRFARLTLTVVVLSINEAADSWNGGRRERKQM
jgi:hypothetical protein